MVKNGVAALSDLKDTTKPSFLSQNSSTCSSSFGLDLPVGNDNAKEQHDLFDLMGVILVVVSTLINWDFHQILHGPTASFHGNYFYINWLVTQTYLIFDLIWVIRVPVCVKSSDFVIKHHCLTIVYLLVPMVWPEFRWIMGACLSVEINTLFLILRRILYKRKDQIPALLLEIVSISFYISWIIIRLFLYPVLMYILCQMAYDFVLATGVLWHWAMMAIPTHFFLCLLYFKWTYELFQPKIAKMFATHQSCPPFNLHGLQKEL